MHDILLEVASVGGKAVLDGFLAMAFFLMIHIAVGCSYIAALTEAIGIHVKRIEYDGMAELYARLGWISSSLSTLFFTGALLTGLQPTTYSLAFSPIFFSLPLTITFGTLLAQSAVMFTYSVAWKRLSARKMLHLSLAVISLILATTALASYKLVTSYMLTPPVTEGLLVVLKPQELDAGSMLSFMVNPSWLPLTVKSIFAGAMSVSLLFSAVSTLKYRKSQDWNRGHWVFHINWTYKMAFLFGAPLAIIGFWNAVVLHTASPVAAVGLMGEVQPGFPSASAALVGELGYLWHIAVIGAVVLAAFAVAFYGDVKVRVSRPTDVRQTVIQRLIVLAAVFWVLDLIAVYESSLFMPRHSLLTVYVLVGGFFLLESLWLYSRGRVRLYVPTALFAVAILGLLLYIGPFNRWYLAERYGGVPWPPIAFIFFIPLGVMLARRVKTGRYILPLISGFLPPLAMLCKGVVREIVRGDTVVYVDPKVSATVSSWARAKAIDLSPINTVYTGLTTPSTLLIITVSYLLFLGLLLYTYRSAHLVPERS